MINQFSYMLSYVFTPILEKLGDEYWGACEQDLRKEFLQQNWEFAQELEDNIKCL